MRNFSEISLLREMERVLSPRLRTECLERSSCWSFMAYVWDDDQGVGYRWIPVSIQKHELMRSKEWQFISQIIEESLEAIGFSWHTDSQFVFVKDREMELVASAKVIAHYDRLSLNIFCALAEAFAVSMVLRPCEIETLVYKVESMKQSNVSVPVVQNTQG